MSWRQNSDITTAPREPATPPGPPGPQRISRGRTAILAVVFVALVAGIAGLVVTRGSDDSSHDGVQGATGTLPAVSTVPAQSDQRPALLNTGEDWDTIVRSIVRFSEWLKLHPNPELLDEYTVPTHKDYADTKLGLTNLATKGWRYDPVPAPVTVERVSVTTRMSPTRVGLAIRFGPAPQYRVVDQAGNEVYNQPSTNGNTVEWTLARTPADNPHWRVEAVLAL